MVTGLLKCISIGVLLLGLLMRFSTAYGVVLEMVICVAALAVVTDEINVGTVLIKEGTRSPIVALLENEPLSNGWKHELAGW
jgi:hypothetical protein